MLVRDGEQSLKDQLTMLTKHEDVLANLQAKMTEQHKVVIAYKKKVKSLLDDADEAGGKVKKT
jgi:hypothetical protein